MHGSRKPLLASASPNSALVLPCSGHMHSCMSTAQSNEVCATGTLACPSHARVHSAVTRRMLTLAWPFCMPSADGWPRSHDWRWVRPLLCVSSAYWGWYGVDARQRKRCVASLGRGGMDAGHHGEGTVENKVAVCSCRLLALASTTYLREHYRLGVGLVGCSAAQMLQAWGGGRACRIARGGHGRERGGRLHVQIAGAGLSHLF